MEIPFWKMHGAGNDFVLVDDRQAEFPSHDREWMAGVSQRRTGVGCEGIILIQPSRTSDFRMRFFNPDGGEVEMCGNGARCVARLAHEIGAAPASMTIETVAGQLTAEITGERVRLTMTPPKDWRLNRTLAMPEGLLAYGFVNSGVPHAVVRVENLDAVNVAAIGAVIRRHADFAPAGTNANFIAVSDAHNLRIRTYERGVEAETLACGTGMVAAALVAGRMGWVHSPVTLNCASGDQLEVTYSLRGETPEQITLLGPAEHVFKGVLTYPD